MSTSPLLIGAALGAALVALAEWRSGRTAHAIYGVGLIVAATIYVGFAVTGGAGDWIGTEFGGAFVFAAVAVGGIRRYPYLLALGWALHVGWDIVLHGNAETTFVPEWYPSLCVGFDLVVAGAIFAANLPFERSTERAETE